jgi:CRISPR system Cascade subunit CasE
MYISRVDLNLSKRDTVQAMASPSRLHGAIEKGFSARHSRTLCRIDTIEERAFLLTVSEVKPDLSIVADQFGFAGDVGQYKEYAPFLKQISDGQVFLFRLCANPTHRVTQAGTKKILAHQSSQYQRTWLINKSQVHGFSLTEDEFDVVSDEWKIFKKRDRSADREETRNVTIKTVTFSGLLTVTDTELFREALTDGIERAKAYGCGLLTIARAG